MKGAEPLGALAARARELDDDARSLARLLRALRADPRTGARRLAERVAQRLAAIQRERRRVARLFALRRSLARAGAHVVAGVDEVGMGPLAGPVVAAAVVLGDRIDLPGLDDSKKLLAADRVRLDGAIRKQAVAVGVAEIWPDEIARRNLYYAGLEAMRQAVCALGIAPDHVLVDARTIPGIDAAQTPIVGGDARDGSIAAASIVAKVHRDALMVRLDAEYPGYGFAIHKGYATRAHRAALRELGPCAIHRPSFVTVAQLTLFEP